MSPPPPLRVRALLRAATDSEITEALEATLQGLRDFEGIEIERDAIPDAAIDLRVED